MKFFLALFVLAGFLLQGCATSSYLTQPSKKKSCCEKNISKSKLPKNCSGGFCKLKAKGEVKSIGKDCVSCKDKNKNCSSCKDNKKCASNYCPLKASKKSCCKG
jgi:hypothetical protein